MKKIIFKNKKFDSVFIRLYAGLFVFLMGIGAYDYWAERDAMVLLVMGIICVLLSLWILASYHQLKIIIDGSFLKVR
ncbi:MAG: hypothetical protein K0M63_12065 [Weeksellaceae bacterium]|nr:hypothetical protein [Weeksellaceae bacterium]